MQSALGANDQSLKLEVRIDELRAEHRQLDQRLNELDNRVWLSPDEEYERKTCQKLKLLKKDQIYVLEKKLRS